MPLHVALGSAPAEMSCSLHDCSRYLSLSKPLAHGNVYLKIQSSTDKQFAHVDMNDLAVYNGMLTIVQVNILPQMGKTIGDGSPKSNGSNGASAMPSLQTR